MSLHRAASLRVCAAIFTVVGCPALVACGSDSHSAGSESDSRLGRLSAQLSAIGPDGATYSLVGNTLLVTEVGSDAGSTPLTFESGMATQTFSLPAGSYTAILSGALGMSGQYSLGRAGDGGATSVSARLTDGQPIAFTVSSGMTTQLTMHFAIQSVGNVTFGTGTLNTAIAVTNSDGGSPTNGAIASPIILSQVTPAQPNMSVPNASIKSMITAGEPTTFSFNTSFSITGPFVAGIDVACAPVHTPFVAMPTNNVNALFDEATNGTGTLCFYDANGWPGLGNPWGQPLITPISNAVVLTMTRTGTPQTPAGMMAISTSATWTDVVVATPASPIYNGTTASLAALQTATSLTLQQTLMGFDVGLSDQVVTQGINTDATQIVTLTLSP